MLKIFKILVIIILLNGCVTLREQMIQQGHSVNYVDGYLDGHDSGDDAGSSGIRWMLPKFTKDSNRYEYDNQYRQGWEDGFRVGKGQAEAFSRAWGGT